ncbi:hypothetical protein [Streptomyces virginiae]|uniref:hypothetical protein n=1 Tax=Streptomyces virginiae TaxID=1961 RepID=UPI00341A75A7
MRTVLAGDWELLTDVHEAAVHLADIGRHWGRVLSALGRERHAHALVARLLATPDEQRQQCDRGRRQLGHASRASPAPMSRVVGNHPWSRDALRTALISEEARQVHGALIAGLPFTPSARPRRCSFGDQPTYGSPSAAALLATKPVGIVRLGHATAIFTTAAHLPGTGRTASARPLPFLLR